MKPNWMTRVMAETGESYPTPLMRPCPCRAFEECVEIHDNDGMVAVDCALNCGRFATEHSGGEDVCKECGDKLRAEEVTEVQAKRKHGPLYDCGEFAAFTDDEEPTKKQAVPSGDELMAELFQHAGAGQ